MNQKKVLFFLVFYIMIFAFAACSSNSNSNDESSLFETVVSEIQANIDQAQLKSAINLCNEALDKGFSEDQQATLKELKKEIYSLTFPGTYIIRPDEIISVSPSEVGKDSYFDINMLKKYDQVFCRYTFEKWSEQELAVKQYKEYLDKVYIYTSSDAKSTYTSYHYSDEKGNGIHLQVFNDSYSSCDFCVIIDKDMYDETLIDMTKNASLLDPSILILD